LAISAEPEGIPRRSIRPLDLYRSINALAETVIGLFKTEVIHRRGPWRSFESVEFATLEWVDWYNNRRLLESIGNVPPAEAEAAYHVQLEVTPMAA
jgi:putative transposase